MRLSTVVNCVVLVFGVVLIQQTFPDERVLEILFAMIWGLYLEYLKIHPISHMFEIWEADK